MNFDFNHTFQKGEPVLVRYNGQTYAGSIHREEAGATPSQKRVWVQIPNLQKDPTARWLVIETDIFSIELAEADHWVLLESHSCPTCGGPMFIRDLGSGVPEVRHSCQCHHVQLPTLVRTGERIPSTPTDEMVQKTMGWWEASGDTTVAVDAQLPLSIWDDPKVPDYSSGVTQMLNALAEDHFEKYIGPALDRQHENIVDLISAVEEMIQREEAKKAHPSS